MERNGKRPYVICLTETFKRTVVVWSDSEENAVKKVSDSYDAGEIDVGRNCFEGCDIRSIDNWSESDIDDYDEIE